MELLFSVIWFCTTFFVTLPDLLIPDTRNSWFWLDYEDEKNNYFWGHGYRLKTIPTILFFHFYLYHSQFF